MASGGNKDPPKEEGKQKDEGGGGGGGDDPGGPMMMPLRKKGEKRNRDELQQDKAIDFQVSFGAWCQNILLFSTKGSGMAKE